MISRRLVSLSSLLLVLATATLAHAQAYTKIVVFGDSLSDTGNFARQSTLTNALPVPGPLANYTAGRFTDGKDTSPAATLYTGVWIEQLAASLPAKPIVSNSLNGGLDYAFGSANSGPGTQVVAYGPGNKFSVTIPNVGQQIATYLATKPVITPATLFVVWSGAIDVLGSTSAAQVTAAAALDLANIQALIKAGATDILIPNLPPLGAIPRLNASATLSPAATLLSAGFNQALAAGIAALPAANPGKTLHLFALDTFSLFNSVLVAPTKTFGFADVTASSQGVTSAKPDTYLFWDDLHPTTGGHHLLSLYAKNLLTAAASSNVTLTTSLTTAVPAEPVTLTAVVAPATGTKPIPTGTVTFYAGTTPLVDVPLDATGTAEVDFPAPPVNGSPYAITAQFSGDAVYKASVSTAQTLTVVPSPTPTVTTITVSASPVNVGQPVTFKSLTTSAAPVGPIDGTVTFLNGTSTIGTSTVVDGAASFTTSTLPPNTYSITASFTAKQTFGASKSAGVGVVVAAPSFALTATPSALVLTAGMTGTTVITMTPFGGFTGSYALACATPLPAHVSCAFSTPTLAPTSNNMPVSSTLTIATNAASASLVELPFGPHSNLQVFATLAWMPFVGGLALLGRRRRALRLMSLPLVLVAILAATVLGTSGCSSAAAAVSPNTPVGSYTIPVTATTTSGAFPSTLNIPIVVQ